MDILIPSPLPIVEPGDLIERLNKRSVSRLVLDVARQYAEPKGKAQAFTAEQIKQIKQDLAAYPLFEYLSLAFVARTMNVSSGAKGYRQSPAPLKGRIDADKAAPYRPALDWFALAGLVHTRTRLGLCECGKFFIDAKHRGKAYCSAKCGGLHRAHTRYEKLIANKRQHAAYKKKQRELMRARRAAGLA